MGGPNRTNNGSVVGATVNASDGAALHQLWSFAAGGEIASQPIVANGTAYFGAWDGYEYALNTANGSLRWKSFLGLASADPGCSAEPIGITSTATYENGVIYVNGGTPALFALNASNGTPLWNVSLGGPPSEGFYLWSSPLVVGNDVYDGISSRCDKPLVAAGLAHISISTRSVVGYFNSSVPQPNGTSIWAAPSINTSSQTVYVTTGNAYKTLSSTYADAVIALNSSSLAVRTYWTIPIAQQVGDGDFGSTPILYTPPGGPASVSAVDKNGYLYGWDQGNLTPRWSVHLGPETQLVTDASYGGNRVYVIGPAAVVGGVAYSASVLAVNPLNGSVEWQVGVPNVDFGYGAPLYLNGTLIIPDGAALYVLDAATGRVLITLHPSGGQILGPASTNGREIFVGVGDDLVAYDVALTATPIGTITAAKKAPVPFAVHVSGGVPPYAYAWEFGDGRSSAGTAPSHKYTAPGIYSVTVNVSDAAGNSFESVGTVVVTSASTGPPTYSIEFSETGLPSSDTWYVNATGGTSLSGTGATPTLTTNLGPGVYRITESTNDLRFRANVVPAVDVTNSSLVVSSSFGLETYGVTFTETGLPAAKNWSMTFDSVERNLTTVGGSSSLVFPSEPNGSYAYSITDLPGQQQLDLPAAGAVLINGSSVTEQLTYGRFAYPVTFEENAFPAGRTWSVVVGAATYRTTSTSVSFYQPNGTYAYSVHLTGLTPGNLTVHGAALVVPLQLFPLTFQESGLSPGTSWVVATNGATISTMTSSVTFFVENGSYAYLVPPVAGYGNQPGGEVNVSGVPAYVPIAFGSDGYVVTFVESGLASGASWSVTIGASRISSTSSTIALTESNGTFPYVARTGFGETGVTNFTVAGAGVTVPVPFYKVSFIESGLASGTRWQVTVGGIVQSWTGATISFYLGNGTYDYQIGALAGLIPILPASLNVTGASISTRITFAPYSYLVSFTQSGLPTGKNWTVEVGSVTHASSGGVNAFLEPNGTYSFTLAYSHAARVTGTFGVSGAPVSFSYAFLRATFNKVGLPTGTDWSVSLNGGTLASTGSVNFYLPNGSYPYTVSAETGYRASSSGTLVVAGSNVSTNVVFTPYPYAVTFVASGLLKGGDWNVTFGNSTQSTTGNRLVFSSANGSTAFRDAALGYVANPASGNVTVSGANVTVSITFASGALVHGAAGGAPATGVGLPRSLVRWTRPSPVGR